MLKLMSLSQNNNTKEEIKQSKAFNIVGKVVKNELSQRYTLSSLE